MYAVCERPFPLGAMSNEYFVTVYKATSPPAWVTTVHFVGPGALVSEVKSALAHKLEVCSNNIVFLNYNDLKRGEGGDGGARMISDKDCICRIEDYKDDASSDDYGGEFPSAQPQRFTLRYSVRTESDDEVAQDRSANQCPTS